MTATKPGSTATDPLWFESLDKAGLATLLLPLAQGKKDTDSTCSKWASRIFVSLYKKNSPSFSGWAGISKKVLDFLTLHTPLYPLKERWRQTSTDGTTKFLWGLQDGMEVETVLIPQEQEVARSRHTLCISTQVGCPMGCGFCLTGTQGFVRNLEVAEIVAQVRNVRLHHPVTNIVFMGMGEPMLNLDNVIQSCRILMDQEGLDFSKRRITISTCGIVPGIERLGKELEVALAISLNATTDETRSQIMPVNNKWNLATLLKACRQYPMKQYRRIIFEYVLIQNFNDSLEDAHRLAELLTGIPSIVNLIPYNENPNLPHKAPTAEVLRSFQALLLSKGIAVTIRASRGREISAACGQLKTLPNPGKIVHN